MNHNTKQTHKKRSKDFKSDNFCSGKIGRAITKWGALDKSPILR